MLARLEIESGASHRNDGAGPRPFELSMLRCQLLEPYFVGTSERRSDVEEAPCWRFAIEVFSVPAELVVSEAGAVSWCPQGDPSDA